MTNMEWGPHSEVRYLEASGTGAGMGKIRKGPPLLLRQQLRAYECSRINKYTHFGAGGV